MTPDSDIERIEQPAGVYGVVQTYLLHYHPDNDPDEIWVAHFQAMNPAHARQQVDEFKQESGGVVVDEITLELAPMDEQKPHDIWW